MTRPRAYVVWFMVLLSPLGWASDTLETHDDEDKPESAEVASLFLEVQFTLTDAGEMVVLLRTDDVNAQAVATLANYFARFNHFVDIIDITDPYHEEFLENSEQAPSSLTLPPLMLQKADDVGEGPSSLK
ncbi:MAG: hypothetical protein AAGB12_12900 [Pseudomonadota bacterium]